PRDQPRRRQRLSLEGVGPGGIRSRPAAGQQRALRSVQRRLELLGDDEGLEQPRSLLANRIALSRGGDHGDSTQSAIPRDSPGGSVSRGRGGKPSGPLRRLRRRDARRLLPVRPGGLLHGDHDRDESDDLRPGERGLAPADGGFSLQDGGRRRPSREPPDHPEPGLDAAELLQPAQPWTELLFRAVGRNGRMGRVAGLRRRAADPGFRRLPPLNLPTAALFDGERILVTDPSMGTVFLWKAAGLTPIGTVPYSFQGGN